MPDGRFYCTTAIDYPNSRPHIGTAFEKIGADVQARYRRMQGADVFFLMGNDENTDKVARKARDLGRDTQEYVDDMARQFREVWAALEISNDDFIQTSEPRHKAGCQKFIQAVHDAGDIYKATYQSLYCPECEEFKTERDLDGGRCKNHPHTVVETRAEENYYFALAKYRDRLLALYAEQPEFIQPESRRNEIVSLVEGGLQDVSISRKGLAWGIPVPFDPGQTIYVWFDALLNYITGVGYGADDARFRRWWPADVHFIGKDIIRFHCALWPAMLMSVGIELPRRVFAHGFVYRKDEATGEVRKISKSIGNVVEPMEIIEKFSAEAFRYYFMSQCPFGGDGEFSFERFAEVYNAGLANNLGNLYSRTLTMCLKYFDGRLAGGAGTPGAEVFAGIDLADAVGAIQERIEACDYSQALGMIWHQVLDSANRFIDRTKPFELARTDRDRCRQVLADLAEAIRVAAILIKPFLPATAAKLYAAFDYAGPYDAVRFEDAARPAATDRRVTAPLVDGKVPALFPRIQV